MKKIIIAALHTGYWFMYLFVLTFVLIAMAGGEQHITLHKIIHNIFYSPFGMFALFPGLIGFYAFYGVLFNRYLTKKKFLKFSVAATVVCLGGSAMTQALMYVLFRDSKINWTLNTIVFAGLFIAFIILVHGIVGLVIRGFIAWYKDIKVKVELQKKNHEMELELIRSQINPHFLFNTINNIDVLIQKDAAMASDYLNKLSDMLRFMLYETKTEKIYLSKELSYIEKYISLQKIRASNPNYVSYEVKGEALSLIIAPMLFMPFIENAFKHAENKRMEHAINIRIFIKKDTVSFECENKYSTVSAKKPNQNGLGNELIAKRLQLLYPTSHTLETIDNDNTYKVKLALHHGH